MQHTSEPTQVLNVKRLIQPQVMNDRIACGLRQAWSKKDARGAAGDRVNERK